MSSNKTIIKTIIKAVDLLALFAVGIFAIPPLMKKYSNMLYKKSLKKDEIDLDNLEPKIVKTEDVQRED